MNPVETHNDLNDVHGSPFALVQVDTEIGGEVVENQVAAVEGLQHQDLLDRRRGVTRHRHKQEPASHGGPQEHATRAGGTQKASYQTHQVFARRKDIHVRANYEIVARRGPDVPLRGRFHGRSVHGGRSRAIVELDRLSRSFRLHDRNLPHGRSMST